MAGYSYISHTRPVVNYLSVPWFSIEVLFDEGGTGGGLSADELTELIGEAVEGRGAPLNDC
jgi:hypothetical protein